MATDFRVVVPNRPGAFVEVLSALGDAGINIDGFCGDLRPGENWGFLHVLVDDAAGARDALEQAAFEITGVHEVDVLDVEDRPGALAETVRRYSDEMRNIEVIYQDGSSRVVIGTEDMQKERYGVRVDDAR